jgi:hypothetical protein
MSEQTKVVPIETADFLLGRLMAIGKQNLNLQETLDFQTEKWGEANYKIIQLNNEIDELKQKLKKKMWRVKK